MYRNCLVLDTEQTYGDVGYVITQETRIVSFGQLIVKNLFAQSEGSDGYKRKVKRYKEMVKKPQEVNLNQLFEILNELISQYKIDTIVCHSLAADKKVFASWALDREVVNPFIRNDIELYDSTKIAKAILGSEHKEYGLEYTISTLHGEKIKQHHTGLDDAALTALLVVSAFYYQDNLNNAVEPMRNYVKQLTAAYFSARENLHILVEQANCATVAEEKIIQEYNIILDKILVETKNFSEQLHNITENNIQQYDKAISQHCTALTAQAQTSIVELKTAMQICSKEVLAQQREMIAATNKYYTELAAMEHQLAVKSQQLEVVTQKLKENEQEYKFRKLWNWLCPVIGVCSGVLAFVLLFVII